MIVFHCFDLLFFNAWDNDGFKGILFQITQLFCLFHGTMQNAVDVFTDLGERPFSRIIELIAQSAAELLLKQLAHEPIEKKRVIVPTKILPGQTV